MDNDVPFDVIWTQAVGDHSTGCCRGFGVRQVAVVNSDFEKEDPGWWHVFKVSNQYGRSDGHYFYKFVALPQGTYGFGKRGCASLGWSWEGEFLAGNAMSELEEVLAEYLEENNQTSDFHHVHLGVKMDQVYAPKH